MTTLGKITAINLPEEPLTPQMCSKKRELVQRYKSFWEKTKYMKGWMKPIVEKNQVIDLLEEAAEIVIRIKAAIGKLNDHKNTLAPKKKVSKVNSSLGTAHEYLWNLELDLTDKNNEQFIHGIVHATFSNTGGYFYGLSRPILDDAIKQAHLIINQEREKRENELKNIYTSLLSQWKKTAHLFSSLFPDLETENPELWKDAQNHSEDRQLFRLHESISVLQSQLLDLEHIRQMNSAQQQHALEQDQNLTGDHASSQSNKMMVDDTVSSDSSNNSSAENQEKEETEKSPSMDDADAEDQKTNSINDQEIDQKSVESEPETNSTKPSDTSDSETESQPQSPSNRDQLRHSSACLLRVKNVADGVEGISSNIKELSELVRSLELPEHNSSDDEVEILNSELKKVEKLQSKTNGFTDGLERCLLELDSIVGSESARPKRKEQVVRIQNLMKDVDSISEKLRDLHGSIKKEYEEAKQRNAHLHPQKAEQTTNHSTNPLSRPSSSPPPHHQNQNQPIVANEQSSSSNESSNSASIVEIPVTKVIPEEPALTDPELLQLWKKLKLEPQFEVQPTREAYQIVAMIPGMNQKDVEISIDEKRNTLTIKGFRIPSEEELRVMRRQIREMDRRATFGRFYPRQEPEVLRLLRLGSGRFGSFSETYNLPKDCLPSKISASYDDGELIITLPRKPQLPVHKRPLRHSFNPYFPQNQDRSYGFLDDDDLWW